MTTIRPATARDLPALVQMIRALATHHGDEAALGLATAQRLFTDDGAPACALVAEVTEGLAGYAVLLALPDLRDGSLRARIDHLYVRPERRGQGVGRALVRASAAKARTGGASVLTISTDSGNPAAAAAYRAMGLTERPAPGPSFTVPLD